MEEIRVHPRGGCGPGTNRALTEPGHPPGAALPDGTAKQRPGSAAAGQRQGRRALRFIEAGRHRNARSSGPRGAGAPRRVSPAPEGSDAGPRWEAPLARALLPHEHHVRAKASACLASGLGKNLTVALSF